MTEVRLNLYKIIAKNIQLHGRSPTREQMRDYMQISMIAVDTHIRRMIQEGVLRRDEDRYQNLELTYIDEVKPNNDVIRETVRDLKNNFVNKWLMEPWVCTT